MLSLALGSAMMHALRLRPGDELMSSLKQYCSENNLRAAYIATCVGSLKAATLRLANADRDRPNEIKTYDQRFEIVSVVGTISCEGAHIHLGLADATGAGVGGHLISATVFTTAEIVLGEVPGLAFERRFDDATGFKELSVERRRDFAEVLRPAVAGVVLVAIGIALGRRTR